MRRDRGKPDITQPQSQPQRIGPQAEPPTRLNSYPETSTVCKPSSTSLRVKQGSEKLTKQLEAILATLPVFPLEVPTDRRYGQLRAALEVQGNLIGPNDLLVAAHALALGAVLMTDNTLEFERVQGLVIENWL